MKKAMIITYGCAMNVNESAKIKKMLMNMGYTMTETLEECDLVFLNTCTVREGAAVQIYGKLGELKQLKENRGAIIGITGCFAQEQGEALGKKFPTIDIIMGNQNIGKIPEAIDRIETGNFKNVVYVENKDELPSTLSAEFESKYIATIPIAYGCNNYCTYCIFPYVRGRERSVPMEEIISEVKTYIDRGYKEIILIGQNVNSYGKEKKDGSSFSKLLIALNALEGEFWIRFISPHPRDFTDDVIEAIAVSEKVAKNIHVPVQAGSSRILKLMNRGYSKEDYLFLIDKLKTKIPDIGISTDIIVGFPGETEEDFLDTLDVVEKVQYENSYMFMYSIRKGTKAAEMTEQISEEVKNERLQRLIKIQTLASKNTSNNYFEKTLTILVEGESKKNKEMLTGRTSTNKVVIFKGTSEMIGTFVKIKVNECKTWTLYGEIV